VVLLLQPIASVGLSAAVLDERPSTAQLLGCAVVLAGVVVATVGRRRPTSPSVDSPPVSATIEA
jgi:drug/metabolite transporter (DMT)-like permease